MLDLPKYQFDRALSHIMDGNASEEDVKYVVRNIKRYEEVIDRFRINGVNGNREKIRRRATATVVDFTRRNKPTI